MPSVWCRRLWWIRKPSNSILSEGRWWVVNRWWLAVDVFPLHHSKHKWVSGKIPPLTFQVREGSVVVKEHNEEEIILLTALKPKGKGKKGSPLLAIHSIRKKNKK